MFHLPRLFKFGTRHLDNINVRKTGFSRYVSLNRNIKIETRETTKI